MPTTTQTPTRPRLKHAMTATAMAVVQARNVWRSYFAGLAAERRARMSQRTGH